MLKEGKMKMTLDQLRTGTVFKVVKDSIESFESAHLTQSGVYQVGTARADHGRNFIITDLAGMRMVLAGTYTFDTKLAIRVSRGKAKEIEVYLISSR
jgi:hypothetical protein